MITSYTLNNQIRPVNELGKCNAFIIRRYCIYILYPKFEIEIP